MKKDDLSKRNRALKCAIERYDLYKRFVEAYNKTKSLDEYINHINLLTSNASDEVIQQYENMINLYNNNEPIPLLQNLYDKLLAADEYKNKLACELKSFLSTL